jgi:hypothetical protein
MLHACRSEWASLNPRHHQTAVYMHRNSSCGNCFMGSRHLHSRSYRPLAQLLGNCLPTFFEKLV